jgi:hypothetical protein
MMEAKQTGFYSLLRDLKVRPAARLACRKSIHDLYSFLSGYQFALYQLGVPLDPEAKEFTENFESWLQEKVGLHTNKAWSQVLCFYSSNEFQAFDTFFELFEEFVIDFQNQREFANSSS